jgi:hypothetical protein
MWVGYVKARSLSVDIRCEKRYDPPTMPLTSKPINIQDFLAVPVAGGRYRAPSRVEVDVVDEPGIPYDVTLTIEMQDKLYVCASLTASRRPNGPAVTAEGLRSLPVASLVRRSVQDLVTPVREEKILADGTFSRELGFVVDTSRRRRQPGEDVEPAAVLYAVAQLCGQPPTKAVSDELGIPLGTARRLVAQARERGLLPPAS